MGENGAFAIIDNIDFYIKAPKVRSIDTTGAGDAFNGAFAFGLSKGLNGKDSLTFTETEKVFDPEVVYEGQENPTKL